VEGLNQPELQTADATEAEKRVHCQSRFLSQRILRSRAGLDRASDLRRVAAWRPEVDVGVPQLPQPVEQLELSWRKKSLIAGGL
jgi:hypothetical protein